jgi:hypothetical protein
MLGEQRHVVMTEASKDEQLRVAYQSSLHWWWVVVMATDGMESELEVCVLKLEVW